MENDDWIDKIRQDHADERIRHSQGKNGIPLRTKFMIGATVIGGIAVGTFLFLFFITLFIYLFLPLMMIWVIWELFRQFKR